MTERPQKKPSARKKEGTGQTEAKEEIGRIIKPLNSDLALRGLAASIPGTTALADAVKSISSSSALADAARSISSSSRMWADLAQTFDWAKSARLHSEAFRAMNISAAIQQQREFLRALDGDMERLKVALPMSLQGNQPEKDADNGLESEIRTLTESIQSQNAELAAGEVDPAHLQQLIAQHDATITELQLKLQLAVLFNQVHPVARRLLQADDSFKKSFLETKECRGFVVSVDIRRSTELMLKARRPEQYAEFVSQLTSQMTEQVLDSFGVFDKFTGDGILAFFPDFYSGEDAGYHAASAAMRCHQIFQNHYREHRSSFVSILQDAGLGIGIDYGNLHLVQVSGALTVVGYPVVYACRLGGAPAGSILINQPAYEVLSDNYGNYLKFEETSLDLKHEGGVLAYRLTPTAKSFDPQHPGWLNSVILKDDTSNG